MLAPLADQEGAQHRAGFIDRAHPKRERGRQLALIVMLVVVRAVSVFLGVKGRPVGPLLVVDWSHTARRCRREQGPLWGATTIRPRMCRVGAMLECRQLRLSKLQTPATTRGCIRGKTLRERMLKKLWTRGWETVPVW